MRKLFAFIVTSLDGYVADPDGGLDWQPLDEEFDAFSREQLTEIETLVFGRVTYEGMVAFWTTAAGRAYDPDIAAAMNTTQKYVVSTTLSDADWSGTTVLSDPAQVADLKAAPGGGVAVFGSSRLTTWLLDHGLLDELRVMVHPVVLGAGLRLLEGADRTGLQLTDVRPFGSGSVLLTYRTGSRP